MDSPVRILRQKRVTLSARFSLMAEAGIYAGFRDGKYESLGFRVILNFR